MKYSTVALVLIALFVSSCQSPIPVSMASSVEKATLSVSVKTDGRSVLPGTMTPVSYRLNGTGPQGMTVGPLSSTNGAFTLPNLSFGTWTLTVGGWDAATGGNEFLTGTTTVALDSPTASAAVTMAASSGVGTLVLNLDWSGTGRVLDSITGTLTPLGGGTAITVGGFTFSNTSATKSVADVPVGSYLMTLTAKLGTATVANAKTETLLIYRKQTSTWSATLKGSEFKSSEKAITEFKMSGAGVNSTSTTINESLGTISVVMPGGTSLASLTPTITTSSLASVSPASGVATTAFAAGTGVSYTVTAADGSTKAYTVTVNNSLSTAKAITEFKFVPGGVNNNPGFTVNGVISGTSIAVNLPSGSPRNSLVATFATTGTSVKVGSTAQTSGTTSNDFSNALTYTVDAADATSQTYTVTVKVNSTYVYRIRGAGPGNLAGWTFNPSSPPTMPSLSVSSSLSAPSTANVSAGVDPLGRMVNFFDTLGSPAKIYTFVIDSATGALSEPNSFLQYSNPIRSTVYDPEGKFLFLLSSSEVVAYPISASGNLGSPVTTGHGASSAEALITSPNGKWAYVANMVANGGVVSFSIGATGALTSTGTGNSSAWSTIGPKVLAIDPTSQYLVGSNASGAVVVFSINQTNGALSNPATLALAPTPANVKKVVFAPSGKAFYLIENSYELYVCSLSSGTPGAMTGVTLSMGATPTDLLVDRYGTGLYAVGAGGIVPLTIAANNGAVTANSPPPGLTSISFYGLDPAGKYFLTENNGGAGEAIKAFGISGGALSATADLDVNLGGGALTSMVIVDVRR